MMFWTDSAIVSPDDKVRVGLLIDDGCGELSFQGGQQKWIGAKTRQL